MPLTLLVLLIVFGSLVAAGIPLLLALSGVGATLGLLSIPSHLVPMDPNVSAVVLLVGLAVGVDYSLFYLKREREERAAGKGHRAALEAAAATSGRSVLISGLTVMVAMAGLLFSGDKTYLSFGIATMLVVAVAMLALPDRAAGAALAPRRQGREGPHPVRRPAPPRAWREPVLGRDPDARPAAPGRDGHRCRSACWSPSRCRRSTSTPRSPGSTRCRRASRPCPRSTGSRRRSRAARRRPSSRSRRPPTPRRSRVRSRALKTAALESGLMTGPIQVDVNTDRSVTRVAIPLEGNGTDSTSLRALHELRDTVLPQTVGQIPGVTYAVTGGTAASADENTLLKHSAPLVFGFVLTFAFLLLLISFRSVVIAGKAIVLNLLSVGAAYGLLVIVFQWGWGESLLNFRSNGGIAQWLPIFMFVILFGLSMDYHVFILSRIREAYDRGMKTEDAVAHGIKTTAGVVTSAAVVMVGVFSIFATLPIVDMKEMGIGLAAAVLIDATIVRALLLPAAMKLLGDWNWYLPNWLGWLPRLDHGAGPVGRVPVPETA